MYNTRSNKLKTLPSKKKKGSTLVGMQCVGNILFISFTIFQRNKF